MNSYMSFFFSFTHIDLLDENLYCAKTISFVFSSYTLPDVWTLKSIKITGKKISLPDSIYCLIKFLTTICPQNDTIPV